MNASEPRIFFHQGRRFCVQRPASARDSHELGLRANSPVQHFHENPAHPKRRQAAALHITAARLARAALGLIFLLSAACSVQLPRRLTPEEQSILAQARGSNVTAGVVLRGMTADLYRKYYYAYSDPERLKATRKSAEKNGMPGELKELDTVGREVEFGNRLIAALRATGLFHEVNYASVFAVKPDVLIEDIGPRQIVEDDMSPWTLATPLSLGLIPSGTSRMKQFDFTLREADASSPLEFHYRFRQFALFGWFPAIWNLHPDWAWRSSAARERDHFALRILASPGILKTLLLADRKRELYGGAAVTAERLDAPAPLRPLEDF